MAEDPAPQGSDLLNYEQVAQLLGVEQASVRRYAVRDVHFPKPAPSSKPRRPLFEREAIDAYIEQRNSRGAGASGRPARTAPPRRAPAAGGDFGARVRAAIASGRHSVTTQRQLAELFEISTMNLARRLNGEFSWKPSELRIIKDRLGVAPSRRVLVRGAGADTETRSA